MLRKLLWVFFNHSSNLYLNKRNSPFMLPAWSAPVSPFLSLPGGKQKQGENQPCQCAVLLWNSMKTQVQVLWQPGAGLPRGKTMLLPPVLVLMHNLSGERPVPRTSSPLCKATMREHSLRDGAGPAASPACRLPGYRSSAHPRINTRTYWWTHRAP